MAKIHVTPTSTEQLFKYMTINSNRSFHQPIKQNISFQNTFETRRITSWQLIDTFDNSKLMKLL